jgi:polyhydroxybutyrate depolymerase
MTAWCLPLAALLAVGADPLGPGDSTRTVKVGDQERSYVLHVPKSYDAKKPTPLVVALHGAAMNAEMMQGFTGLDDKADAEGFLVAYPNGTGASKLLLTWNAGGFPGKLANKADDVAFIAKVLDDVAGVANVDAKRVYATGMSNGAMMTYRLAAELSDRIAAVAPVAGTIAVEDSKPKRPVSVMHFHGTKDAFVPFDGPDKRGRAMMTFLGAEESVKTWAKLDGCDDEPKVTEETLKGNDKTKVTRKTWGGGKGGAEVVLFVIDGGGHTWPGQPGLPLLGKTAKGLPANDLMWEFFKKHPME